MKNDSKDSLTIQTDSSATLRAFGGSRNDNFNNVLLNGVNNCLWLPPRMSEDSRAKTLSAAFAAMGSFAPADEIEGMIAAQAVAMHFTSIECSRRAMISDQTHDGARESRKAAANASRAFIELLAALDRKRGKGGQQKVTVEHVHIHAGGQAIVGAVASTRGGGAPNKGKGKPHAPPAVLADDTAAGAVCPSLRSASAEREAVPVAGDAERPLPDARRL